MKRILWLVLILLLLMPVTGISAQEELPPALMQSEEIITSFLNAVIADQPGVRLADYMTDALHLRVTNLTPTGQLYPTTLLFCAESMPANATITQVHSGLSRSLVEVEAEGKTIYYQLQRDHEGLQIANVSCEDTPGGRALAFYEAYANDNLDTAVLTPELAEAAAGDNALLTCLPGDFEVSGMAVDYEFTGTDDLSGNPLGLVGLRLFEAEHALYLQMEMVPEVGWQIKNVICRDTPEGTALSFAADYLTYSRFDPFGYGFCGEKWDQKNMAFVSLTVPQTPPTDSASVLLVFRGANGGGMTLRAELVSAPSGWTINSIACDFG